MLRGHRGVILATVGWLILAAPALGQGNEKAGANPSEAAQQQQTSSPSKARTGGGEQPIEAARYGNPCNYQSTHEDSDLCAQWTAAIAARDSAAWNSAQFKVSVIEAAGLGLSLIVSALAAMAAFRALRLTKRTAQAQLRPYVYVSQMNLFTKDDFDIEGLPEDFATVVIDIKNFGATPAIRARATMTREVWEYPPPKKRKAVTLAPFAGDTQDMPPGLTSHNRLDFTLSDAQIEFIQQEKAAVYAMGRIEYFDTLGDPHHTNFMLFCTGDDIHKGEFRSCSFGNDAT